MAIKGQVRIRSSTVTTSQADGEAVIKAVLKLEGFKTDAQAHKCLHFIAEQLVTFEGQEKLA
jgi:hypothetical protein